MYDQFENSFKCACSPKNKGCVHTVISKWYINQTSPKLFSDEESAEDADNINCVGAELDSGVGLCAEIPSNFDVEQDTSLKPTTQPTNPLCLETEKVKGQSYYFFENKKLPFDIPKEYIKTNFAEVKEVSQLETCHFCNLVQHHKKGA